MDTLGQWQAMLDRLQRIATPGSYYGDLLAAEDDLGRLFATTDEAENWHFPATKPDADNRASTKNTHEWRSYWRGVVLAIAKGNTAELNPNPLHFRLEDRGSGITVGHTDHADYRVRAERYADVCRVIVEGLTEDKDGPIDGFRWRHNGVESTDTLRPAAWRMAKHLWEQPDHSADFDDLLIPVYEDQEHLADGNAFGSLRRDANTFFQTHGIPWRVAIKKTVVSLTTTE